MLTALLLFYCYQCTDYEFEYGTECLHLAQQYSGAKVKLIDGPHSLWKVCHPYHLIIFLEIEIKGPGKLYECSVVIVFEVKPYF